MLQLTNSDIEKAIIRSQHCQRNWDLSKEISQDDLDLLMTAATQCPSKQNVAFYKLHFITNREIIEKIHDTTRGFTISQTPYIAETNSQVLANLLIVFEEWNYTQDIADGLFRNDQTQALLTGNITESQKNDLRRDREMAVGIAAGYLNLTASLLGYSTGCCACFAPLDVQKILNLDNMPLLLMGIGFKNPNMNRRIHHTNTDFVFPTKIKQPIRCEIWK